MNTDWKNKLMARQKLMKELPIQTVANAINAVPCRQAMRACAERKSKKPEVKYLMERASVF